MAHSSILGNRNIFEGHILATDYLTFTVQQRDANDDVAMNE